MDNTGSRPLEWRLSTETKAAFKATELAVYVVISSASWWPRSWLRPARTVQQPDYFRADRRDGYITLLTIGCMVARGSPSPPAAGPFDHEPTRCHP